MSEMSALDKAKRIAELSLTKKAEEVIVINMEGISDVADQFVICHGDSEVQVKAIADAVIDGMRDQRIKPWHKEGYQYLRWILLDYGEVVVHVFLEPVREYYDIERLWIDAPRLDLEIDAGKDENS